MSGFIGLRARSAHHEGTHGARCGLSGLDRIPVAEPLGDELNALELYLYPRERFVDSASSVGTSDEELAAAAEKLAR